MKRAFHVIAIVLIGTVSSLPAQESNSELIRFKRDKDVLFLNCQDVASRLGYELKIVSRNRLITFCRDGKAGFCIPIQLAPGNYRKDGENLMLSATLIGDTLNVRVVENDAKVSIEHREESEIRSANLPTAGYNAKWPSGRGFRKGQTLPDIPLVDLKGKEVRFSQFLGKRYILYAWASW